MESLILWDLCHQAYYCEDGQGIGGHGNMGYRRPMNSCFPFTRASNVDSWQASPNTCPGLHWQDWQKTMFNTELWTSAPFFCKSPAFHYEPILYLEIRKIPSLLCMYAILQICTYKHVKYSSIFIILFCHYFMTSLRTSKTTTKK